MSNIYIQEPPTNGKVLLRTSVGDIDIELWSKEAPKTCRNFVQLCLEGYYDNVAFHRVVRDFIVQGGDPTETGEGGESVYGAPFKDEFHSRLRFVRRGLVAMANAGPNDNGSQFFFTMGTTPELQNKHTIFGKVVGDTLYNMLKLQEVEVEAGERPTEPHRILHTEVLANPYDDIVPRQLKRVKKEGEDKKIKSKSKATKNFSLLSFGEEAEEDEEQVDKATESFRGKSKSSHDLTDDPRLSSIPAVDEEGKTKKMESPVDETRKRKASPADEEPKAKQQEVEDEQKKKLNADSVAENGSKKLDAGDETKSIPAESKREGRKTRFSDITDEDKKPKEAEEGRKTRFSDVPDDGKKKKDVEDEGMKKRKSDEESVKQKVKTEEKDDSKKKKEPEAADDKKKKKSDERDDDRKKKKSEEHDDDRKKRKSDEHSDDRKKRKSEEHDDDRKKKHKEEEDLEKRKRKNDSHEDAGRKKRKGEDEKDQGTKKLKNESAEKGSKESEEKRNATEDKRNATEDKRSATEDKRSTTEDKRSATEDKRGPTEDVRKKLKKETEGSPRGKESKSSLELLGEESRRAATERMEELKKEARQLQKDIRDSKKRAGSEGQKNAKVKAEVTEDPSEAVDEEAEGAEEGDLLTQVKKEREKYKMRKKMIGKKEDRETATLEMLAKFQNRLAAARTLAGDYDDDGDEEKEGEEEEDPSDMSWLRHKLHFEDEAKQKKVIDANVHDNDRYQLSDPRNPLTQRRRESSKKAMRDKR